MNEKIGELPHQQHAAFEKPITFYRCATAEEVAMRHFSGFTADDDSAVRFESLDDVEMIGGSDENGNDVDGGSGHDFVAAIKDMGYWGFANTTTREISYWSDDTASREALAYFLAHEVGHLVGIPVDDHMAEERRADSYGFAMVAALGELLKISPSLLRGGE